MGVEVKFKATGPRAHAGSCAECRRRSGSTANNSFVTNEAHNSPLTYTRARKSHCRKTLSAPTVLAKAAGINIRLSTDALTYALTLLRAKVSNIERVKALLLFLLYIVVGFLLKLRLIFLLSGILAEKIKRYYNFQPGERRRKQEKSNNPNSVSGREGIATTATTSCGK